MIEDPKVLIALCDGFSEYEYAIPVMALHFQHIPFEVAGPGHREITGMTGLIAIASMEFSEVSRGSFDALLLPGIDRC
jgi:putative intracellular protease/amidase